MGHKNVGACSRAILICRGQLAGRSVGRGWSVGLVDWLVCLFDSYKWIKIEEERKKERKRKKGDLSKMTNRVRLLSIFDLTYENLTHM